MKGKLELPFASINTEFDVIDPAFLLHIFARETSSKSKGTFIADSSLFLCARPIERRKYYVGPTLNGFHDILDDPK